jgi:hypothetical protein
LNGAIRLWHHLFDGGGPDDLVEIWTAVRIKDNLVNLAAWHFGLDQLEDAWQRAYSQDRDGREVYFCAHLLQANSGHACVEGRCFGLRRKANAAAAPVLALWSDVDTADLSLSPIRPTAVVESSPGRLQAYARLSAPLDPLVAEQLNKRWTYSFGADKSGWDLGQVLRVPGTHNHKYEGWPEVKV